MKTGGQLKLYGKVSQKIQKNWDFWKFSTDLTYFSNFGSKKCSEKDRKQVNNKLLLAE